jgi:hypothetical protein
MTVRRLSVALVAAAAMLPGARARAQMSELPARAIHRHALEVNAQEEVRPSALRPLKIGKWLAAVGAAGAAVYGFVRNGEADDAFRTLEEACEASPQRCVLRNPGGSYADADFERLYQEVLGLDRKARNGLILSQVGVVTSVVLFLLDLRNDVPPPDIPYTPPRLNVAPTRDGGVSLAVRLTLGR